MVDENRLENSMKIAFLGALMGQETYLMDPAEIEIDLGLVMEPKWPPVDFVNIWLNYLETLNLYKSVAKFTLENWHLAAFVVPALWTNDEDKFYEFFNIFEDPLQMAALTILRYTFYEFAKRRPEKIEEEEFLINLAREIDSINDEAASMLEGISEFISEIKTGPDDEEVEMYFSYFDPFTIEGIIFRAILSIFLSVRNWRASLIRVVNLGDSSIQTAIVTGALHGVLFNNIKLKPNEKKLLLKAKIDDIIAKYLDL